MLKFNDIPAMGLGTYGRTGNAGLAAISAALEVGFRHIDTAQTYDTEKNVGEAFSRSGLPRGEVFITTKVAREKLATKDFLPSLRQSLDTIGVDRVDLTLIHWPSADASIRFEDYIQSLAQAKALGLTRLIGVSNFPTALIERAVKLLGPGELATNQVEMHPFLQNRKVLECCRKHGVAVTAYMPFAKGRVVDDPVLKRIGAGAWREREPGVARLAHAARRDRHPRVGEPQAFGVQLRSKRHPSRRMPTRRRSQNSTAASGSSIRPTRRNGTDTDAPNAHFDPRWLHTSPLTVSALPQPLMRERWRRHERWFFVLALLIGIVAGLRAMTAPAVVSWAAYLGWINLGDSWLWWLGHWITPWIFTLLAIVELVNDQRASTPSRTVPVQFGARIVMGALTGAAIGTSGGMLVGGLIAGIVGAIIGTLGGKAVRARLAASFGKDPPAAFLEDAVAIIGGLLIVAAA